MTRVEAGCGCGGRAKAFAKLKKEHEQLKRSTTLKKSHRLHFRSKSEVFAFLEHSEGAYPIRMSAGCMGSCGWVLRWKARPVSERAVEDERWSADPPVHARSRESYAVRGQRRCAKG